ncbi:MAG: 16S rRNA (adenine(1518)-N(6)/adenine(1519)-N(6))-dimethyltransferase RsmA [Treponema sp.]|nr:16S rRNA (adenine(1518)-N(6)/adenine(1519)-N(6))-dimethyltransferase RsmA [Treponema sp.]
MTKVINYDSPQALRRYLDERGLGMRQRFGQNFLINGEARKRLLDALEIGEGDTVWEVGPGLGAMTAGLLERGAVVTAFEIDRGFVAALEEIFRGTEHCAVISGDVLQTWRTVKDPGSYFLGNLPYNIAARLLADFIESGRFFKRMVVTVQREVARRITARPGTKDYSSFSVLCGSVYTCTPLLVLKGASFYPQPNVESQGVRFDPRPDVPRYSRYFYPLIRCLFAARRKTVKNNLMRFVPFPGEPWKEILERAKIPGEERAENLGVAEFAVLAEAVEAVVRRPHGDQ